MLLRDTVRCYRLKIESAVGKDATGKEVLDYIFGTSNNDYRGQAGIELRVWSKDNKKPVHRLNMLWAIPLTLLLAPVRYVLHGDIGWDTKTKMGRFILRVTGHLK